MVVKLNLKSLKFKMKNKIAQAQVNTTTRRKKILKSPKKKIYLRRITDKDQTLVISGCKHHKFTLKELPPPKNFKIRWPKKNSAQIGNSVVSMTIFNSKKIHRPHTPLKIVEIKLKRNKSHKRLASKFLVRSNASTTQKC